MEYPTLPIPAIAEEEKYYCPFGCKGPECDEKGYCAHLIGFTTDRESMEPIGELLTFSEKKNKWQATGHLTVNHSEAEQIQPEDRLINPIFRDKLPKTGQEYDRFTWVSWRVYTDNPDRVPIPIERKVPVGPRSKTSSFELKHRKTKLDKQLSAPSPDEDIEVNPRKATRQKANQKVAAEAVAKAKKRLSTEETEAPAELTEAT